MKSKRIIVLVVAVAIFGVAFLAGNGTIASAVPVPTEINEFIAGLVFAGVTAGFVWLFNFTGLDLKMLTEPAAGAISLWLLTELQGWVNLIPPEYDTYVSIAFRIIVVILGGIGALYVAARARGSMTLLK